MHHLMFNIPYYLSILPFVFDYRYFLLCSGIWNTRDGFSGEEMYKFIPISFKMY